MAWQRLIKGTPFHLRSALWHPNDILGLSTTPVMSMHEWQLLNEQQTNQVPLLVMARDTNVTHVF